MQFVLRQSVRLRVFDLAHLGDNCPLPQSLGVSQGGADKLEGWYKELKADAIPRTATFLAISFTVLKDPT